MNVRFVLSDTTELPSSDELIGRLLSAVHGALGDEVRSAGMKLDSRLPQLLSDPLAVVRCIDALLPTVNQVIDDADVSAIARELFSLGFYVAVLSQGAVLMREVGAARMETAQLLDHRIALLKKLITLHDLEQETVKLGHECLAVAEDATRRLAERSADAQRLEDFVIKSLRAKQASRRNGGTVRAERIAKLWRAAFDRVVGDRKFTGSEADRLLAVIDLFAAAKPNLWATASDPEKLPSEETFRKWARRFGYFDDESGADPADKSVGGGRGRKRT